MAGTVGRASAMVSAGWGRRRKVTLAVDGGGSWHCREAATVVMVRSATRRRWGWIWWPRWRRERQRWRRRGGGGGSGGVVGVEEGFGWCEVVLVGAGCRYLGGAKACLRGNNGGGEGGDGGGEGEGGGRDVSGAGEGIGGGAGGGAGAGGRVK